MDRFGIGKIGLTGFGVSEFRLPVFGDGSGRGSGGQGSTFHESLVDVWFMSGYNNADAPAFIRGVKGNELQLKNFAYALNSGFGEYAVDFLNWSKVSDADKKSISVAIKRNGETSANEAILYKSFAPNESTSFKVKITGLKEGQTLYFGGSNEKAINIPNDGVYDIEYTASLESKGNVGFRFAGVYSNVDITITQLPTAYEGALVFDGVDDVAYIENFDTLVGEEQTFTAIANYTVLPSTKYSYNLYSRNDNSNIVRVNTPPSNDAMSGIRIYTLDLKNNSILYKDVLDNEVVFTSFTTSIIPNIFSLNGYLSNGKPTETSTVAYDWVAIYRGTLTPEEIEEEKVKLEQKWNSKLNKS